MHAGIHHKQYMLLNGENIFKVYILYTTFNLKINIFHKYRLMWYDIKKNKYIFVYAKFCIMFYIL